MGLPKWGQDRGSDKVGSNSGRTRQVGGCPTQPDSKQVVAAGCAKNEYGFHSQPAKTRLPGLSRRVLGQTRSTPMVQRLAVRAAMETAGHTEEKAQRLTSSIQTAYVDAYHNSTEEAAYAFALWFYRFDADNWFSFNRMFEQTAAFFGYHNTPFSNLELRLFKGFDNHVFLNLITASDLPVTVNDAERRITIRVVGLAD
jgi:hypothetical protein